MTILFAIVLVLLIQLGGSALCLYLLDTKRYRRFVAKGLSSVF